MVVAPENQLTSYHLQGNNEQFCEFFCIYEMFGCFKYFPFQVSCVVMHEVILEMKYHSWILCALNFVYTLIL